MSAEFSSYRGRFAPSPTGPLHLGSMVCALATWLDARAHNGTWLIRIEDIDPQRDSPEHTHSILKTLSYFGFESDEPIIYQSERSALYEAVFEKLKALKAIYPCTCSRSDILRYNQTHGLPAGIYPGICRQGSQGCRCPAWRLRTCNETISFHDRYYGLVTQNIEKEVGDFVLRRADGYWAYQLAVTADDESQQITHIVRGSDLLDNTPRQIYLQRILHYQNPHYLHIPIVKNEAGEKLSKQTKAPAILCENRLTLLDSLLLHLGLPQTGADTVESFFKTAINLWKEQFEIK